MKVDLTLLSHLITAGFFFCFIFINFILFLISAFFQKKFNQPSPQAGFVISALFCVMYAAGIFLKDFDQNYIRILNHALLLCASISSVASALNLYVKMKRTNK